LTETVIHPDTTLGYVHLTVSDLDRSLAFYQQALGFKLHRREHSTAYLGAGRAELLVLTERREARRVSGTTGLYHFAILVPSRLELAKSLKRLAEARTQVEGFADHLVSEAIYLPDPDGNGIEVYRDRPRSAWQYSNGQLKMATDPLDLEAVLAELEDDVSPLTGLHPDTVLGHVHLHVANIAQAEAFYRDVLGFELMVRYGPSASFLSAGGYHHHIGVNTWSGTALPPPEAVGLRWFVICLPDGEALQKIVARVRRTGLTPEQQSEGLLVRDPVQNGIILTSQYPATA
jgi:catechol 2,3-dioxygenase